MLGPERVPLMVAPAKTMPKLKSKAKFKAENSDRFLLESPEVSIFLACVSAVNELRNLAAAYECGDVSRVAFSRQSTTIVAGLCEVASATERFDIVCPVLEFGKFSPFFWRWFNWWNDFLKDLTPRQVSYLERSAREGAASRCHRPQNDWVKYRHTPAFALVIT
jgi:hypothetical protein